MRKRERPMIDSVVGAGQYRLGLVGGSGPEHGGSPDVSGACMDGHGVETEFLFDPAAVNKSRRRGR
jgi:hypothetical protein